MTLVDTLSNRRPQIMNYTSKTLHTETSMHPRFNLPEPVITTY